MQKGPQQKDPKRIFKELASGVVQGVVNVLINTEPQRQTDVWVLHGSKVNQVTPSLAESNKQLGF